jgi:immunity protein Imm1 of predicted polymorphic toxin system
MAKRLIWGEDGEGVVRSVAELDAMVARLAGQQGKRTYRGDWSEFPPESGLPVDDAHAALRQFFETEALPDNLTWREV